MEKKTQKECEYIEVLQKLKNSIIQGNVDKLKSINDSLTINKTNLKENERNPFRNSNPVILASREKQKKVLQYLLSSESKLIENSYGMILPTDEDEAHHNAFYYAIRSGDSELVQLLISSWPGNYFNVHNEELDEVISSAYRKLKINNVILSKEISFFIEKQLIELRFNAKNSQQCNYIKDCIIIPNERVKIVTESVNFIRENYRTIDEIDDTCLFELEFIAQNIHVLKQTLRSTYNRLPWEEIEFCLIIFISTHKTQKINLYYYVSLDYDKILDHLRIFVEKLKSVMENINTSNDGEPRITEKRKVIVEYIKKDCAEFKDLYENYEHVRDLHSLEKIKETLKLGLHVDVSQTKGKLVITRMLQIIGEYMKNTLESPKLSDAPNEQLLESLPPNTRDIVKSLRDSLSHSESLLKRREIEENKEDSFFHSILYDLIGIGSVVDDILQSKKAKILTSLIDKICNTNSFDEYREVIKIFQHIPKIDITENFINLVYDRIIELVDELCRIIPDQTEYEEQLFQQIYTECRSKQNSMIHSEVKSIISTAFLKCCALADFKVFENNFNDFKELKILKECDELNLILKSLDEKKSIDPDFKYIIDLLNNIFYSIEARSLCIDDIIKIFICVMRMISDPDIKWIQELYYKLGEKAKNNSKNQDTKALMNKMYSNELSNKQSILERILNKSQCLFESFELFKKDKQTQAAVEMLIVDIMEILAYQRMNLGMNFRFVDSICPVLVGTCLRNHLAHNNEIVKLLLDDPELAIFLNAQKLITVELVYEESKQKEKAPKSKGQKKKLKEKVEENISSLKTRHESYLQILKMKQIMFAECEKGNIDNLKSKFQAGADVNSRCRRGNGVLYFASKCDSVDVLNFLLGLNQNLFLSINELEVAVLNGRTSIVEFIMKKLIADNIKGDKLPLLHIAAKNGHKDIVEILIKNKYDPKEYSLEGMPIHYATQYNHKNVVEILLKNGNTIDDKDNYGFSLLHIAALYGYTELVEYLLNLGANIHEGRDKGRLLPIHIAAIHGQLEVIRILISKEADVDELSFDGVSLLYIATYKNYVNLVSFLLEYGANVDAADRLLQQTPLHLACTNGGNKDIVELLLKKGANGYLRNSVGSTAMHFAVVGGHKDIFTMLFDYGLSIHAKTHNLETLLHCAAQSGQKEIADTLINNKLEINATTMQGITPLYFAAQNGYVEIVDLLINNGASVNLQAFDGRTPLHVAAFNNHKEIIIKLIKSKVKLDVKDTNGITPLSLAIMCGHKDVTTILIEHEAQIIFNNSDEINLQPLNIAVINDDKNTVELMVRKLNLKDIKTEIIVLAVLFKHTDIAMFLINCGVDISFSKDSLKLLEAAIVKNNNEVVEALIKKWGLTAKNNGFINEFLFEAVNFGQAEIVNFLLRNGAVVDENVRKGTPLLVAAASYGYIKIFKSLIEKCTNINAVSDEGKTALHIAARCEFKEEVELLLDKGANINFKCNDGTPLHFAAAFNEKSNIVELLLKRGADVDIENKENLIPIQLAVQMNKIDIVNSLLSRNKIKYLKYKGTADGFTLLHIAAQKGCMDMIRNLIDQGANIDEENNLGSKPIHVAANYGYTQVVKFFLRKGSCVNEPGYEGQTLLHMATFKGQIKMVEYLISENANVNAQATNGDTPLHFCAIYGFKEIARLLLNNGAFFNVVNKCNVKPIDMAKQHKDIAALLKCTEHLLKAVKRNDISAVENCIAEGAVVNAKNFNGNMPLHYAAWKGNTQIVEILLKSKANVNAPIKNGITPLHYAAKYLHINVVKILLSNGAIHNSIFQGKSTPLDLARDETIVNLLKTIDELFEDIQKGEIRVLSKIEKIKDAYTVKAIMNARNRNNQTLLMAAMLTGFPKIKEFKEILLGDLPSFMNNADALYAHENYEEALEIYQYVLEEMKTILSPNNFALLDVKEKIAGTLCIQKKYDEALNIFHEIKDSQEKFLGPDYIEVLNTQRLIDLVIYKQGNFIDTFDINKYIYERNNMLEWLTNSEEMTSTRWVIGFELQKYIHNVWEKEVKTVQTGECNSYQSAEPKIEMFLSNTGQMDEEIQIFKEMRKQFLGSIDADTVKRLHGMAVIYKTMARYEDAITIYEDIFKQQKKAFGLLHRDTINTQLNIGISFFKLGKTITSLKTLEEYLKNAKTILKPKHPNISIASSHIAVINSTLKLDDSKDLFARLQDLQRRLTSAVANGEEQTVIDLINNGVDVNDVDEYGRSALYYAVENRNTQIVRVLLEYAANIYQVTKEGNTMFHAAAAKGCEEIVEVLLKHEIRENYSKVIEIINTITLASGSAPLHVAAENGSFGIVKSLLKKGAAFDRRNNEYLMASEVSSNQDVTCFLKFVEDVFSYAINGDVQSILSKLEEGKSDQVKAVKTARNFQYNTLLQVVLINCDISKASDLVLMLKDEESINQ